MKSSARAGGAPSRTENLESGITLLNKMLHKNFTMLSVVLVALNFLFSIFVIHKVPYTEIDWETYMSQVESYLHDGQLNYTRISGPTGPLVYPAAHVHIFSLLHTTTSSGKNVRLAQYIFAATHSLALAMMLRLYRKANRVPTLLLPLLALSRRVLSLFVLRLFNDALQTIPLFAALLCFAENQWALGCFLYSLAVGIKMNALLYVPGLAVLLCQAEGPWTALKYAISICLPVQLIIAAPFLYHDPKAYVSKAFEFSRSFLYKWSVNGAFLPKDVFADSRLSILLLVLHLMTLLALGHFRWTEQGSYGLFGLISPTSWRNRHSTPLRTKHVLFVLMSSNFCGIVFARTLHYQFYIWYYYSLLYLVWGGVLPVSIRLMCIAAIEGVFNIYPPHPVAATVLSFCHFSILISLFLEPRASTKTIVRDKEIAKSE